MPKTSFPVTEHFNGKYFFNLDASPSGSRGFLDLLKWKLGPKPKPWPEQKIQDLVPPQIHDTLAAEECRVTFINHASVLLQWSDFSVLTDPVFSERLGPANFLNLKRYRDPGINFAELPKVDLVFISHNHYDHLDLPTLQALQKRDVPVFVVPLGVSRYLDSLKSVQIKELDWWESAQFFNTQLEVTLTPAQHWSRRAMHDTNQTWWASALFKAQKCTVYFAGDTGYGSHFKTICARYGQPDLALLPIGAYEPRWFMRSAHMNPDDAVRAHQDLNAALSVAMHFGTFRLTNEAIQEPEEDLQIALKKYAVPQEKFLLPKHGQSFLLK